MDYSESQSSGYNERSATPVACCGVCGRCDSVRRRMNSEKSSSSYM